MVISWYPSYPLPWVRILDFINSIHCEQKTRPKASVIPKYFKFQSNKNWFKLWLLHQLNLNLETVHIKSNMTVIIVVLNSFANLLTTAYNTIQYDCILYCHRSKVEEWTLDCTRASLLDWATVCEGLVRGPYTFTASEEAWSLNPYSSYIDWLELS